MKTTKMKVTTWIPVVVLVGSVLTVGSVFASQGSSDGQSQQRDPAKFFGRMDADGNGELTLAEFTANAENRRQKIKERRAAEGNTRKGNKTPPTPSEVFSRLDENSDGSLTQSEFTKGMANRKSRRGASGGASSK